MTMFLINPGRYRHIITIQKVIEQDNPYGERPKVTDEDWIDILTTRAAINPISGKDVFEAMMTQSEITHKIFMRYHPTIHIDSTMRIKFGDRIFSIIAPPINFQEKNVELQILAKERV
jgi:SPP1 family predicted phage head-tail adaptor